MRWRYSLLCVLVMLSATALGTSVAHAGRPLTTGFSDPGYLDPSTRSAWFDSTRSAGGQTVRLQVNWSSVAPSPRPPGFAADNPSDPAYRWEALDQAVREATARGLRVLITFQSAPRWAEGGNRPGSAPAGTWRPDPGDVGDFARALAGRYSGSFPGLPRVRYWQIWNEPNLETYLTPQWEKRKGKFRMVSPNHYRRMLNAGYRAVNSVRASNFVVTAGTAPFGDYVKGGNRLPPAQFLRELLCLKTSLKTKRCPDPAHFDALAHHPYGVGGPRRKALNRDDVAIPDLRKLKRPLAAARRTGRALPRGRKALWVTEMGWDSKPPDPFGVPQQRHARWLEEAFYLLWKQGVSTINWYLVRDQAKGQGYDFTYQSGVFLRDGRAKPAARAFKFPFVLERKGSRQVRFWGRAPSAGQVRIERKQGGGWRVVRRARTGNSRIFTGSLKQRSGRAKNYRARIGNQTSLTWRQK